MISRRRACAASRRSRDWSAKGAPAAAQGERAEAKEADAEHRPGRRPSTAEQAFAALEVTPAARCSSSDLPTGCRNSRWPAPIVQNLALEKFCGILF